MFSVLLLLLGITLLVFVFVYTDIAFWAFLGVQLGSSLIVSTVILSTNERILRIHTNNINNRFDDLFAQQDVLMSRLDKLNPRDIPVATSQSSGSIVITNGNVFGSGLLAKEKTPDQNMLDIKEIEKVIERQRIRGTRLEAEITSIINEIEKNVEGICGQDS